MCDPEYSHRLWLVSRYLPEITDLDRPHLPTVDRLRRLLGDVEEREVFIPRDCKDGFLGAFWQRPEAYLDPGVRRGISAFAKLPADVLNRALTRLFEDLSSGQQLFGDLQKKESLDLGYRLVIAKPDSSS
jgi:hypothetical protein